jgi:hypothetical protein
VRHTLRLAAPNHLIKTSISIGVLEKNAPENFTTCFARKNVQKKRVSGYFKEVTVIKKSFIRKRLYAIDPVHQTHGPWPHHCLYCPCDAGAT